MLTRRQAVTGAAAAALAPRLAGAETPDTRRRTVITGALGRADTMAQYAAKDNMLFGSMIGRDFFVDTRYVEIVKRECSLVYATLISTGVTRRSPAAFDFTLGDRQVAFATQNNLVLGGGYLAVHDSAPPWITLTTDRTSALAELRLDVATPMIRYAGQFDHWIVVNEPLAPPVMDAPYTLRKCAWLSSIGGNVEAGDDYISEAFRAARDSDSKAVLVLNEDDLEAPLEWKRASMLALLRALKRNSVPVDALGLQAHLLKASNSVDYGSLSGFLNAVHELGLKIIITELDVVDTNLPAGVELRDAAVARAVGNFASIVLNAPGLVAVNVWGFTDSHSWYNINAPASLRRKDGLPSRGALLDQYLTRKPAYFALRAALGGPKVS